MPTANEAAAQKDFFVSYNGADEEWAEWIAWQLERAALSVIIQAWDFRPGSNFVLEMDTASKVAERTIVVLSPNFFGSLFTPSEWASSFAKDPTGSGRIWFLSGLRNATSPDCLDRLSSSAATMPRAN